MTNSSNRSIVVWLFTGCVLIAVMVVLGGITRLTHSGLSMVEWKLIMGSIPPLNEEQWLETFEKYKQFPEYKIMHNYFTLADFKSIFMWEYLHRLLGRIIGLVFVIPLLIFWIKGKIPKNIWPQLIIIFVWGGFQGFLGWFMVKSGLVNNPNVSHYRLAIHLVTAFGLCCYILWVALGLTKLKSSEASKTKLGKPFLVLLSLATFQIIYGAFVAGLKAGFIHTTWPKMSSYWIDPAIFRALGDKGIVALFQDPITVQFIHRWIAFLVLGVVVYVIAKVKKTHSSIEVKRAITILISIVVVQIGLGILTLVLAVPITIAVLHQLAALLFLMSIVFLIFLERNDNQLSSTT